MYHPLVWFEGRTGLLLRTRLRPGRDASATGVVDELRHILPPLRRRFPHTPIFLRGDAGMATPAVEAKLEAEGVYYVLGIGTNRVFKARVAPARREGAGALRAARAPRAAFARASGIARNRGRILDAFSSRSTSPRGAQRPLHCHQSPRPRRRSSSTWYNDRGTSENSIKELKLDG